MDKTNAQELNSGWLLLLIFYKGGIIYNFLNVCPLDYTAVAVSRKVCIP